MTMDQPAPNEADDPVQVVLPDWRYAPDAWRWVKRFDDRYASVVLRLRSARVLPVGMRTRFTAMGIPGDVLESTLQAIRSPGDWPEAWVETAQRFLGDYRRQVSARQLLEAAQSRKLAALSYHAAQVFGLGDDRTIRTCRAAAASLFAQAQPYVHPNAQRLMIPWRAHELPAYLQVPAGMRDRVGLVVLLNGASTSKEESFGWAESFLRAGLAVLTLDSPGSGEATGVPNPDHDDNDLLDGVFETVRQFRNIDLSQVSAAGVSLGGNLAIRCAAYDRRIMCVVAVTPPYDPARWVTHASPFLVRQLGELGASTSDDYWARVDRLSLHDTVPLVHAPILVFGAARDLVVPPAEAQLLANRSGPLATLVWYPAGGHCLYEAIPAWTSEAATWISSVAAARAIEYQTTGAADPANVSALAREQLQHTGMTDDDFFDDEGSARLVEAPAADEDDIGSYARVISQAPQAPGTEGGSEPGR
jgi:alpha-beta hydrolase superfamily lysophospholipase